MVLLNLAMEVITVKNVDYSAIDYCGFHSRNWLRVWLLILDRLPVHPLPPPLSCPLPASCSVSLTAPWDLLCKVKKNIKLKKNICASGTFKASLSLLAFLVSCNFKDTANLLECPHFQDKFFTLLDKNWLLFIVKYVYVTCWHYIGKSCPSHSCEGKSWNKTYTENLNGGLGLCWGEVIVKSRVQP